MSLKSVFSAQLRLARQTHKLSQEKVAELISISARRYQTLESKRETGKEFSHMLTVLRLACLFDLDLNALKAELQRTEQLFLPPH